jgi:hypothetical protein
VGAWLPCPDVLGPYFLSTTNPGAWKDLSVIDL